MRLLQQATLNARTSILAAANPINGRYDRSKTLRVRKRWMGQMSPGISVDLWWYAVPIAPISSSPQWVTISYWRVCSLLSPSCRWLVAVLSLSYHAVLRGLKFSSLPPCWPTSDSADFCLPPLFFSRAFS